MSSRSHWKSHLSDPGKKLIVQLYEKPELLIDALVLFLRTGIDKNQAVVIISTSAHANLLNDRCRRDRTLHQAVNDGRVLFVHGNDLLERFMVNNVPDWACFRKCISNLIDKAQRHYSGVRIFSEMVDLLKRKGNIRAAEILFDFWSRLHEQFTVSSCVAYQTSNIDIAFDREPLSEVAKLYGVVFSAFDDDRYQSAFEQSILEVVGPNKSSMLYLMVQKVAETNSLPKSKAALLWMKTNMPFTLKRVIERSSTHYKKRVR